MKITVDGETYPYDLQDLPNVDCAAIQRSLGCGMKAVQDRVKDYDVTAIQAVLWAYKRRTNPSLRIDDVTFTLREWNEAVTLEDADVRDVWPKVPVEERAALRDELPAEQRDRIFDEDGNLRPEPRPDPLPDEPTQPSTS